MLPSAFGRKQVSPEQSYVYIHHDRPSLNQIGFRMSVLEPISSWDNNFTGNSFRQNYYTLRTCFGVAQRVKTDVETKYIERVIQTSQLRRFRLR